MEIRIGIMLNEERCLLNYEISFEWILYPMSRSVPLIAAQELNYSSTMLSNPPTSASVVHSSLLLHVEPRVCWSPFSIIIWARRRPGIPQRTYRHSNHSSSLFVGRLLLYSELLYSPQGPLFLLNHSATSTSSCHSYSSDIMRPIIGTTTRDEGQSSTLGLCSV